MKLVDSGTFYLELNTDEMIEHLVYNVLEDNSQGMWRIDIQPGTLVYLQRGLDPEKLYFTKPKWHQAGNFYPPEAGYMSEIPIEEFFDMDILDEIMFDPDEIESSIKYFEETARLSLKSEVVDEVVTFDGKTYKYTYKIKWS